MKKIFVGTILLAALLIPAWANNAYAQDDTQGAKQDMKDAGRSVGRATKKTARKAEREVKKGTHKSARTVRKGAGKVENKTEPH